MERWFGYTERINSSVCSIEVISPNKALFCEIDAGKAELTRRGITDFKQKLFRPTEEQANSELFKEIVGTAERAKTGKLKGTFPDFEDEVVGVVEEIKSGKSLLKDSN